MTVYLLYEGTDESRRNHDRRHFSVQERKSSSEVNTAVRDYRNIDTAGRPDGASAYFDGRWNFLVEEKIVSACLRLCILLEEHTVFLARSLGSASPTGVAVTATAKTVEMNISEIISNSIWRMSIDEY